MSALKWKKYMWKKQIECGAQMKNLYKKITLTLEQLFSTNASSYNLLCH